MMPRAEEITEEELEDLRKEAEAVKKAEADFHANGEYTTGARQRVDA